MIIKKKGINRSTYKKKDTIYNLPFYNNKKIVRMEKVIKLLKQNAVDASH